MSNRTVLILFSAAVLVVGAALWTIVLSVGPATQVQNKKQSASDTTAPPSSPAQGKEELPAIVRTEVDPPAVKLERAKRYLEPTLSVESVGAARRIISTIPTSTAEYAEGRQLLKQADARLKSDEAAEAGRLRDALQAEYKVILSEANPHLNYIRTSLTKYKGGFALWGTHEYFTRYSFSIGGDANVVSAWINNNRAHLEKAGIIRVGVKSSEGWGGSCWFDV